MPSTPRVFLDAETRQRLHDVLKTPDSARASAKPDAALLLTEFLEDTVIRCLTPENRRFLREAKVGRASIASALDEYVLSIDPPVQGLGSATYDAIADELLSRAVALTALDAREAASGDLSGPIDAIERSSKRLRLNDRMTSSEVANAIASGSGRAALERLATALGVEASSGGDVVDACVTLERCVAAHERFIAGFESASGLEAARNPPRLEDVPSGIGLDGDAEVERAVAVARLLHVNDLRRLQSDVDAFLVSMQEYTADPKTDSRMGRVGR